ncbi:hypothetical protein [Pararhodobacter oceanensis]|nr:hypothetical protein [Pararhodobacter oceanensis]
MARFKETVPRPACQAIAPWPRATSAPQIDARSIVMAGKTR